MQGVCPKSPDQNTAGPGGGIKAPLFFFATPATHGASQARN